MPLIKQDYGELSGGVIAKEYILQDGVFQGNYAMQGSTDKPIGWGAPGRAPTVTQGSGYIQLVQGSGGQGSYLTTAPLNLSGKSGICIELYGTGDNNNKCCVGLFNTPSSFNASLSFSIPSMTDYMPIFVNADEKQGQYYLLFGNNINSNIKIKNIYII